MRTFCLSVIFNTIFVSFSNLFKVENKLGLSCAELSTVEAIYQLAGRYLTTCWRCLVSLYLTIWCSARDSGQCLVSLNLTIWFSASVLCL